MDLLDRFLNPSPWFYRQGSGWRRALTAGAANAGGLYGAMHLVNTLEGKPWIQGIPVFDKGDPLLAVYAAAIALALEGVEIDTTRSYTNRYLVIGALALAGNTLMEVNNCTRGGRDWHKEFEPGLVAHFILTPIWASLLFTPLLHLPQMRGKKKQLTVAFVALAVYGYYLSPAVATGVN